MQREEQATRSSKSVVDEFEVFVESLEQVDPSRQVRHTHHLANRVHRELGHANIHCPNCKVYSPADQRVQRLTCAQQAQCMGEEKRRTASIRRDDWTDRRAARAIIANNELLWRRQFGLASELSYDEAGESSGRICKCKQLSGLRPDERAAASVGQRLVARAQR